MAPEFDDSVDYYDFLSIDATATDAEIQRAYRKTNLKYHPDKFKATADLTAEQAAAKLDLLQKILAVLKDPATRAKYDQGRESRRRQDAAKQKMESDRRRRAEELHHREKVAAAGAVHVNGVKRKYNEQEKQAQDAKAYSLGLVQAKVRQKYEEAARRREAAEAAEAQKKRNPSPQAAEAQTSQDSSAEPDERHRSVKVTWIREGNRLDMGEAKLRAWCERFGCVDSVKVLRDKKRRVDGQKEKTVFGNGLVVFSSVLAAQDAVKTEKLNGIKSVTWAFSKDADAEAG